MEVRFSKGILFIWVGPYTYSLTYSSTYTKRCACVGPALGEEQFEVLLNPEIKGL